MNYNKLIFGGRLTRDPELTYLPNQTPVVKFGMAANRKWKAEGGEEREEVCFLDCVAFGKTAEVINQHCQKGKTLLVEGRLRYEQWEDKQGGKRSKHVLNVESFQFVGSRDDEGGPSGPGGKNQAAPPRAAAKQNTFGPGDGQSFKEQDVPF